MRRLFTLAATGALAALMLACGVTLVGLILADDGRRAVYRDCVLQASGAVDDIASCGR